MVEDKVEDNWEFEDIESLKNWFGNLWRENERLQEQKLKIEEEVDLTWKLE